jgi:hypothetical protein
VPTTTWPVVTGRGAHNDLAPVMTAKEGKWCPRRPGGEGRRERSRRPGTCEDQNDGLAPAMTGQMPAATRRL